MSTVFKAHSSLAKSGIKFFKVLFLILLSYLIQVAVMPHLKVMEVMPNLMMVCIAIMTVSYGKLYAFITGAIFGVLLEAMGMTIPLFYLLVYPVLSLLCAQVFADMSDIKREMRRVRLAQRQNEVNDQIRTANMRRKFRFRFKRESPYDLNAHLRILLNAIMLVALYEGVMLIYIAISLGGVQLSVNHFLRVLYAIMYTAVCCLFMFPVRHFLGFYKRKARRMSADGEQEISTTREMIKEMALVPDDAPIVKEKKTMTINPFKRKGKKAGVPADELTSDDIDEAKVIENEEAKVSEPGKVTPDTGKETNT